MEVISPLRAVNIPTLAIQKRENLSSPNRLEKTKYSNNITTKTNVQPKAQTKALVEQKR